jgi:hypothetical protein
VSSGHCGTCLLFSGFLGRGVTGMVFLAVLKLHSGVRGATDMAWLPLAARQRRFGRIFPAGPGTVEEMSHRTNLSARKFLTMVADCRSDLLKAAR